MTSLQQAQPNTNTKTLNDEPIDISIAIIFHSAYGHTRKQAEAVASGVDSVAAAKQDATSTARDTPAYVAKSLLVDVLDMNEDIWNTLNQVDGMVFGCPTYMGTVSAEFKRFMDDSSNAWFNGLWRDKVAAGFTNSGSYSGDKLNTLMQFALFAMQHSMVWVGPGVMPANSSNAGPETMNRLGAFMGAMAQSGDVSPEEAPPSGDLLFAAELGSRVTDLAARLKSKT